MIMLGWKWCSPLRAEPSSQRVGGTCFGPFHPPQLMLRREFDRPQAVQSRAPSLILYPPALSLPSITPDCIWQMPLLAPYHQVQQRQPKTILLYPYTTSVLHFAWLTHLLLQGLNGAKALSVEQLHESQALLAKKGCPCECIGHGFQRHC